MDLKLGSSAICPVSLFLLFLIKKDNFNYPETGIPRRGNITSTIWKLFIVYFHIKKNSISFVPFVLG